MRCRLVGGLSLRVSYFLSASTGACVLVVVISGGKVGIGTVPLANAVLRSLELADAAPGQTSVPRARYQAYSRRQRRGGRARF